MSEELKEKDIRARVFHIVQQMKHETTGETLLTRDKIVQALVHKTITNWAYILHDKDKKEDGTLKNPHWHIVLECKNTAPLKKISEWFGVPAQYIDIPKGQGAFGDCVAYLTHEEVTTELKYVYEHKEVCANFNIDDFFKTRFEEKRKYGKSLNESERILIDVLENGKKLSECRSENPIFYANNLSKLKALRGEYLSRLEPPNIRINIYITGQAGMGKDLISQAIARSFFPNYEYDEDIFFNVGAKGSAFEGYDGQPVIIWSDRRAIDLIMELNGRGNVFDVFDSHPRKVKQNVKYSSVSLVNTINIINAVEPYKEFLDGLAGEYTDRAGERRKSEDKSQSYRRFPIILELDVGIFEVLANKGWLEDNNEFLQYLSYGKFRMGLKQVAEKCANNKRAKRKIEEQTTKPIIELKEELEKKEAGNYSDEELLEMFAYSGTRIEDNSDGFVEVQENPFKK